MGVSVDVSDFWRILFSLEDLLVHRFHTDIKEIADDAVRVAQADVLSFVEGGVDGITSSCTKEEITLISGWLKGEEV